MTVICATTANFPGIFTARALARLVEGISEPQWGPLSVAHVQICPQNPQVLTESVCEQLRSDFPQMQLRLHANARVWDRHQLLDAATFSPETRPYYEALADRSRRLGANAYSLHAGVQAHATRAQLFDRMHALQDVFGDIRVAVEGLYPRARDPQLMSTWADYAALLETDLHWAMDLSHLQIVARHEGHWDWDVARALLASPQCLEVHVSDNDGRKDAHALMLHTPAWVDLLDGIHPDAVCFSEGDQIGPGRRTTAA